MPRYVLLVAATIAGALCLAPRLDGATPPTDRTTTSPEGIIRTVLEATEDDQGNVHQLILDTFPAGIDVPVHHHPVVGLNYIISGRAESQYAGEPMRLLNAGDSFVDHANLDHVHFRNPDRRHPLKILIWHVQKKGQPFFILGHV